MIPTYRCISKSQDRKKFVLQDLQSQKQYRVDKTELKTKLSAIKWFFCIIKVFKRYTGINLNYNKTKYNQHEQYRQ